VSDREWNTEVTAAIREALFEQHQRTVLIQGAPGSGKTYTAVLLALEAATHLDDNQRALVLTFSVSAVDQIQSEMDKAAVAACDAARRVEIINYHAFYKRLLDAYANYCAIPRDWRTWLPHEVEEFLRKRQACIQDERGEDDRTKLWELSNATCIVEGLLDSKRPENCTSTSVLDAARWFKEQYSNGHLHYDSWAYFSYHILAESLVLRQRLANRYPFVIIDEFQDTNGIEWAFIRELAAASTLVCMMDSEQAIYRWKGADPERRLDCLQRERGPATAVPFSLHETPRARDAQQLAAFAEALRDRCPAPEDGPGLLASVRGVLDVSAVPPWCRGEQYRGACDGEWPNAYAAHLKRSIRSQLRRKRVAVLCPTWALLGCVAHVLRSNVCGGPLQPAIVGLEEDVGVFFAALTHALAGRTGLVRAQQALDDSEVSLDHMMKVVRHDHRIPWFGRASAGPQHSANVRRRDGVRKALNRYVTQSSKPELHAAIQELPSLAATIRRRINSGSQPVWLADSLLDRYTPVFVAALENFARRNPGCDSTALCSAARRAVDACVARERRHVGRSGLLLMTAHAAKGKEFDVTFLVGASSGTHPLNSRPGDPSHCESVRNLFRVACSRSREKVVVLHRPDEPCCILARLLGNRCPMVQPKHRSRRHRHISPEGTLPLWEDA